MFEAMIQEIFPYLSIGVYLEVRKYFRLPRTFSIVWNRNVTHMLVKR